MRLWQTFLCALVLLIATLMVGEFRHAFKPLVIEHRQGTVGMVLVDAMGGTARGQGTFRLRVSSAEPGLPLAAAGGRPGDFIEFDDYENRWRKFLPGERIGLTLYQGERARHLSLVALPETISIGDYVEYGGRLMLSIPALLFAVMIGLRRDGYAYRALSMTFIALSLQYFYNFNYSPAGAALQLTKFVNIAAYVLIWYGCVVFALRFQPYRPDPVRNCLQRMFPWYRALVVLTAAYSVGYALGRETPWLWLGTLLVIVLGLLMVFSSMVNGALRTRGEVRQRHLWLLFAFAVGAVPAFLNQVPALDAKIQDDLRVTVVIYFIGQFVMFAGLAYAVLRYRVFNFDIAASRALVFGLTTVLLLCAVGMIEWLYSSMANGSVLDAMETGSLITNAMLALVGFEFLRRVHRRLESWVEVFLFGRPETVEPEPTPPAGADPRESLDEASWREVNSL